MWFVFLTVLPFVSRAGCLLGPSFDSSWTNLHLLHNPKLCCTSSCWRLSYIHVRIPLLCRQVGFWQIFNLSDALLLDCWMVHIFIFCHQTVSQRISSGQSSCEIQLVIGTREMAERFSQYVTPVWPSAPVMCLHWSGRNQSCQAESKILGDGGEKSYLGEHSLLFSTDNNPQQGVKL